MRFELRGAGARHPRADTPRPTGCGALHLAAHGGGLPAQRDARLDILDLPRALDVDVPGDGTFDVSAPGAVGSLGLAVVRARRGAAGGRGRVRGCGS